MVIDPYLSDSLAVKYRGTPLPHVRMMPAPVHPRDLSDTDLVLCTHAHTDHMDPDTLCAILAASPRALVLVPRHSAWSALERGVPLNRLLTLNTDETLSPALSAPGPGISVTAMPACHETPEFDDAGNSRWLGYLIRLGGRSIYHSGDTVPDAMIERKLAQRPGIDLALLPVNGRDKARLANGVPGNMTAAEALDYHDRFNFGTTILHHFGMFEFNTVDPGELAREIGLHRVDNSVIIPEIGRIYEVQG